MQKFSLPKDSEKARPPFPFGRYSGLTPEDGLVELLVIVLLVGLLAVLSGSLFI
jgi:hypothetical protein